MDVSRKRSRTRHKIRAAMRMALALNVLADRLQSFFARHDDDSLQRSTTMNVCQVLKDKLMLHCDGPIVRVDDVPRAKRPRHRVFQTCDDDARGPNECMSVQFADPRRPRHSVPRELLERLAETRLHMAAFWLHCFVPRGQQAESHGMIQNADDSVMIQVHGELGDYDHHSDLSRHPLRSVCILHDADDLQRYAHCAHCVRRAYRGALGPVFNDHSALIVLVLDFRFQ